MSGRPMGDDLVEMLEADDELLEAAKSARVHEDSGHGSTQYPWSLDDVPIDEATVKRMVDVGLAEDSVGNYYTLRDPEAVERAIKEIEDDSPPPLIDQIEQMEATDVPADIFDPIVGYYDIKRRFLRALESQSVRQSIFLVGPRGSAKSVFMQEILRLPRVEYLKGKDATIAGVEEKLLKNPDFVVVDEFDKLPANVFDVFLNWQDPRLPFSVSKSQRSGEIDDTGPVFATGNDTDRVPDPNLDRFWDFYFESYSEDEFMEVLGNLLPRDFDISPELAEYIGQRLQRYDRRASVRDAERIAEVADTEEDVDEEVDLLEEYGQ